MSFLLFPSRDKGSQVQTLQFCHFSSLTLALFSPPCPLLRLSFYPNLFGKSGRNCLLSPALLGYNGFPDTRFSQGTTQLTTWPDGERYPCPLQSHLVSLSSYLNSYFFSDWRRIVLTKFFDTQIFSVSTEELELLRYACCVLSRLCWKRHSFFVKLLPP